MRLGRVVLCSIMIVALAFSSGCGKENTTFVESERDYTGRSALALAGSTEAAEVSDKPTAGAGDLRRAALISLRRQGDVAQQAADLITATFPVNTPGVPLRVEKATFEGEPAFIVVEAIGRRGGTLSDKRVWALDTSGKVLFAGTR